MQDQSVDGRTLRRELSRKRIVEAVLELVSEGVVEPTADQVSQRAGVTMRTVFRHFEDMNALFREIVPAFHADIDALRPEETSTGDWRADLEKLVQRRIDRFEEFMPRTIAAQSLRHRFPAIEEDVQNYLARMRMVLADVLSEKILNDINAFTAIDIQLNWDTWLGLRRDHGLSVEDAASVVRNTIDAIIEKSVARQD